MAVIELYLSAKSRFPKLSQALSAVGILLVIAAFAVAAGAWVSLHRQVAEARQNMERLNQSVAGLNSQIAGFRSSPIADLCTPRGIAVPSPKKDAQGRPLYTITLWMEAPNSRAAEVAKVIYHFEGKDFLIPSRTAADRSNSFAVSYLGLGCPHNVKEIIVGVNGTESAPLNFDACRTLPQEHE